MDDNSFAGSIVALVTPFRDRGERVDEAAWRALVRWHVEAGTSAIVVAGTTGESATLAQDERDRLLESALDAAAGGCGVIAGTGAASTRAAVEQSRRAAELGADAVLVVTPYYNRPPQRGLERHFTAIADASTAPVILYNVPARTAVDLAPETVARLARHDNIVAIKEAVAEMDRVERYSRDGLTVFSGDDPSAFEAMRHGARGVISVAANVVPRRVSELCRAALAGEFQRAGELNTGLEALYRFLSIEPNPIPVKWLLAERGAIGADIRLPLVELDQRHRAAGRALLDRVEEPPQASA